MIAVIMIVVMGGDGGDSGNDGYAMLITTKYSAIKCCVTYSFTDLNSIADISNPYIFLL